MSAVVSGMSGSSSRECWRTDSETVLKPASFPLWYISMAREMSPMREYSGENRLFSASITRALRMESRTAGCSMAMRTTSGFSLKTWPMSAPWSRETPSGVMAPLCSS